MRKTGPVGLTDYAFVYLRSSAFIGGFKSLSLCLRGSKSEALREQSAAEELFGDLDGVEGGALAQVVRDAPEAQSVRDERVLADAADQGEVAAVCILRRRIGAAVTVAFGGVRRVHNLDTRSLAPQRPRLVRRQLPLRLDVDRLRVAGVDGDADRGGVDRQRV